MSNLEAMVDEITSDSGTADAQVAEMAVDKTEKPKALEAGTPKPEDQKNEDEAKKEGDPKGEEAEENVPFPKKARNAISYRDKKIAKLEAKLREYEAASAPSQAQPNDGAPREEDFDSYAEYLKAQILHEIKSEQTSAQPKVDPQREQFVAEKEATIALKAKEYVKTIPDYAQVLNDHAEMLDYMPAEVQDAFYMADDAALAFYNLAKSGDLASLAHMNPTQAAMMIARAQMQPPVIAQQAPTHKPIQAARGTGKSGKAINDMSPDELLKWVNS